MVIIAAVLVILGAPYYPKPHTTRCASLACVRHWNETHPMRTATASWFEDAGATASGTHYPLGFAALIYGSEWGKRVRFCAARCATGRLEDHGPYVAGRTFDLSPSLKAALGCGDLCRVRYRPL